MNGRLVLLVEEGLEDEVGYGAEIVDVEIVAGVEEISKIEIYKSLKG